ncbi:SAM-dependent methyltransferase [Pseudomonas sp. HK3]
MPFYITCNPMIAHQYAASIVRYWQDLIKNNRQSALEPFYVVELGSGSGAFSFHILKQINIWLDRLDMQGCHWQYVITDFTESNLKHWQKNPAFKPFIDRGQLDFSIFNLESDTQLHLVNSNTILQACEQPRPMVVLANYIFDTVSHDVIQVEDQQLSLGLTRISIDQDNLVGDKPNTLAALRTDFAYKPIEDNHYQQPALTQLLKAYKQQANGQKVLIPLGSLQAIDTLTQIAGGELLLLSSDKGFCNRLDVYGQHDPDIAFHGSFSLMVNYDAIAKYIGFKQGVSFLQQNQQSLVSGAFLISQQSEIFTETHAALNYFIQEQSPSDVYTACQIAMSQTNTLDLSSLISWCKLSYYDPYILHSVAPALLSWNMTLAEPDKRELIVHLEQLAANIYPMPAHDALYDWLLKLYFQLGYWQGVKQLAEPLAIKKPNDYYYWYLLGCACYQQGDQQQAQQYFEISVNNNPEHIPSWGYLEKIEPLALSKVVEGAVVAPEIIKLPEHAEKSNTTEAKELRVVGG